MPANAISMAISHNAQFDGIFFVIVIFNCTATDYGKPMKPFFHRNPKLLGLGRASGQINFGAFGVFLAELSTISPNCHVEVPLKFFYRKGEQRRV